MIKPTSSIIVRSPVFCKRNGFISSEMGIFTGRWHPFFPHLPTLCPFSQILPNSSLPIPFLLPRLAFPSLFHHPRTIHGPRVKKHTQSTCSPPFPSSFLKPDSAQLLPSITFTCAFSAHSAHINSTHSVQLTTARLPTQTTSLLFRFLSFRRSPIQEALSSPSARALFHHLLFLTCSPSLALLPSRLRSHLFLIPLYTPCRDLHSFILPPLHHVITPQHHHDTLTRLTI